MNQPLPTVAIVSGQDKAGFVLINERDFDASVHTRYDPDAAPEPSKAPVLTDLKGIGAGRAAKLAEAGIGTVEALAETTDPATVAHLTGLSEADAAALIEQAKALLAS